jgi:uncharacterized protein YcnI
MNCTKPCRAVVRAGVLVAALALAPSAFAHAHLYPDEVASDHDALIQVAVPNEEKNASTTEITMTVPKGFEVENVATVAGWTATVSGDKVTWKGKLDGENLVLLPFTGSAKKQGDYVFKVSQTYSDGSVVDWAGSEDSDTPAPVVAVGAAEHGAEASHSDSSKTIAIIALVVGALGLLVGGAGLVAGRRSE